MTNEFEEASKEAEEEFKKNKEVGYKISNWIIKKLKGGKD